MSFENSEKNSANRHKARECALQMLFAVDLTHSDADSAIENYWHELGDAAIDQTTREFASGLVAGTIRELTSIDDHIRTRAEHWRIERMAIVDRNVLRLAVYEFTHRDTPNTVVINEGLELARRFSTYEATQFINGILDGIKQDLEAGSNGAAPDNAENKTAATSI